MKTRILTRSPFALFAFFALVALALGCLCPQQAVAEDEGAAPLQAGSGALGAAPSLTAQAEGDLQFVGLEGASVAGSASEGYAIYVRDGDTGYVTLKVKNNSGRDLEFVTMVDGPSYAEGASGLTPVAYGSDDDAFYPITFPPYRSEDTLATGAEHMASQWLTSETTGVGYPGYWIEAGATPTFKLQIDAGKLAAGTYNWNIQLGRVRWDYEEHLYAPEPGLSWKQWDYVGEEIEETYSAQIPIKVVVYSQPNASIKAQEQTNGGFFPTFSDLGSDGFDFGAIDLGSATGEQLKASRTLSVYNDRVAHSSDKVANATDIHGNTTDVRVVFDGENTSGGLDTLDGAFSWGNGTLYDTNWAPLPPTSGTQRADYTASFDATDLIAGTYTGNLIINTTPHTLKFNGATGNATGVYKVPLKVTLTGINPRLLPRATNLTATPGNGRVDLRWTPGAGAGEYTEYTIWRREGTENQDDPDKLDWSLYEEIGVKVVGELSDDDMLYVDATAQNGTTYSYTVIYGRPYHGYAAEVASATPGATYQSPMLAPCADVNDGVGSIEVSWEMHENYGGKNNDGTGMVDHFNIYRDGVLVDQIDRSAVRDEVEYGWREEVPGSGNYTYGVTKHSYSWAVEETVPELYTVYSWAVSAVSPNGVESDLSDSIPAQALGETPSILTHSAWFDSTFYDEATDTDKPAILIYADEYGSGDTLKKVRVWRKEGTSAPSTAGAPYAIADKYNGYSSYMYDFADTNVEKNKTYTYTIQGVDNDENTTNFYTFTVKAVEDVQFGNVKPSNGEAAFSVVNNGTTARLQWNSDYYYDANDELEYAGTYKVYRNDMLIATLSGSGSVGYMDYQDNPGSDGVYTYRVDKVVNASGTNITVRGRDHVFHRNTQPVDPATLLQVPGAPTLTGRTASETNVILSWTPSSEGGVPEGYHIYRTDGDEVKTGGRYVTYTYWNGSRDVYESWGNGRYITLAGNDTLSFVDGRTNDRPNNSHYQNDIHQGTIEDLGWDDSYLPHTYYITAYNRAGESAPSQLVVFDTHDEDQWGNAIAPPNDAAEAPAAPTINNVWVDWEEHSTLHGGFDAIVGGYIRVAWSDVGIGADIDSWTLTYTGLPGYNPTDTETLNAAFALSDPATKLGASQDAPGCSVVARDSNDNLPGSTVTATVTAKNTAGSTVSEPMMLDVLSFPRSYVLPDNGGALIRWTDLFTDTTTQVTGWEIWRKAEYGIWEKAATLSGELEYAGEGKDDYNNPVNYYEWADTGLDNGWTYQYKVVAKCTDSIDRPGQVREVTPERTSAVEAPGAPRNLRADVINGEVIFTWDPPADGGAVGFYQPVLLELNSWDSSATWYSRGASVTGDSTNSRWVTDKPGTYTFAVYSYSYIDGEEVPRTSTGYGIAGFDAMNEAEKLDVQYPTHSNIVTVSITQEQIDQQATTPPAKPAPVATAGDRHVTVTWPACDGATYYTVEKKPYNAYEGVVYPDVPEATIAVVPGQQTYTYVHEDAEPGVKYYYHVVAHNSYGAIFTDVSAKPTGKTRDQVAAERVEALIEALPTVSDIESAEYPSNTYDSYENEVAEVRAVYDALTDKQKSLVDAAAVKKLDDVATALVARKYAAVVGPVQDSVNALPSADDIAAASEEELGDIASQIADVRAAYNALPAEAKPGVDVSKLTDAEAALATARQVFADKAAAKAVDELIGALPALDALSISDEAAVSEAREAYVALTATQRVYVTKLAVLEAAEARMGALRKVEEVKQAIDALSPADELQLDDLGAVAAARDAYEALPESDQPLVGPDRVSKLDACWSKIQELIAASPEYAAARVDELIDAIGEVTPDSADAITEARSAYDALTPKAQSKVEKLAVLEAAEQALEDFEAAAEIDRMISSLPSPLSLDDAEQVAAVREAYDKASESVRAKVTKLSDLEAAEGHIAELKEAARIDLSEPFGSMTLSATSFTYNGADCRPGVVVEVGGKMLLADRDYEVHYANNRNAGTAMVTIFGIGDYKGQITRAFTIKKAANKLSVKAKAKTLKVKYKKVKKKTQKVAALTVVGAQGKLAYKIVKIKTKKKLAKQAKKKIKLAAGGKLTLKKKLKKGTYKVTVRVSASGNGNYLPASRDVTVKVRVK